MAHETILIVEDGSIVPNANSYVTIEEFVAYAGARGITIEHSRTPENQLIVAAEYIASFEPRLKGAKIKRDQPMAFPRSGVVIDGFEWGSDEIPRNVILAQMQVALDIHAGVDPYNPPTNLPIVKERVEGAVEVQYAAPHGGSFKLSKSSSSQALVNSLLKSGGLMNIVLERA